MAGYIGSTPVPQGIQEQQSFTATAGQTTFNTLGYTDGNTIRVTLNGVLLEGAGVDYTATNGSDIVLTAAASADDVLTFETFNEFTLVGQALTTPTISGGTLKSNVTLKNDTEQDTDGGRASKIIYQGEQTGGEISTLAEIEASHDGTADDEKGDLIFRTNDGNDGTSPTEVLRLDSVGSMGLGASIPASSSTGIYLKGGGATYSTSSTYRYDMVNAYFDTAASAWKYIGNGVATQIYQANGTIIFNRAVANSSGAGAALTWVEEARIDSDGVKFNGDTAAANALDDYEEGSFTPDIGSSSGSGGAASGATGKYTKIGNMVFAQCHMSVNTLGSMSGTFFVTGFPFAASSGYTLYQGAVRSQGIGGANDKPVTFEMSAGTANGRFHFASGTSTQLTVAVSQLSAGDFFAIGITYNV